MKNKFILFLSILASNIAVSQTIYSSDGTLNSNRTVQLNGKNLTFNSTGSKMFVNGTNGYLGLGTEIPSSKLHLYSGDFRINSGTILIGNLFSVSSEIDAGIKMSKTLHLRGFDTTPISINVEGYGPSAGSLLQLAIAQCDGCFSTVAKTKDAVLRGSSSGSFVIANERGGDIKFALNTALYQPSTVAMIIDNNGNIGIGTTTPDARLAVNGQIHAKEVRVDLQNWPDFVFDKDYVLPTLTQVEKQIDENGHLANIPSAEEVHKDGIELGTMNKLLLQKIEELTLYIIQMDKEIKALFQNNSGVCFSRYKKFVSKLQG